MTEILKDGNLTYNDIENHLNTYLRTCKSGKDIFEVLVRSVSIDSFRANRMRLAVDTNKDRVERIYAAFDRNYSAKKQAVFTKSSIPVLQLYVALRRSEEITKIVDQLV